MILCPFCKEEKSEDKFKHKKNDKIVKKCQECRDIVNEWKKNNKERVKQYNKMSSDNIQNTKKTFKVVIARKEGEEEWNLEFKTQTEAAEKLQLQKSNINKVIKKVIKTTGKYEFQVIEKEFEKKEIKTWNELKEEFNFGHKQVGLPSSNRILHNEENGIIGKICCSCKKWKELTNYNFSKNHWDGLRNDCKECIINYRFQNKIIINKKNYIYQKERVKIDPEFKLIKTLRSRLYSALKRKDVKKKSETLELTGCSISFLKEHLEKQFKDGMTWKNHGQWHIDHIVPCVSFNLLLEEEQKKCFHYTNLQPLWAKENLSKGGKITMIKETN